MVRKTLEVNLAEKADALLFPDIEKSSGEAFLAVPGLEWIAQDDVLSVERHMELIEAGWVWVARSGGHVVGFLAAAPRFKSLHIWQMAVHFGYQRRGIGRSLITAARSATVAAGLKRMTLTTFRDVPWNEKFYRSCGFKTLTSNTLDVWLREVLEAETKAGLPADRRCAMSHRLGICCECGPKNLSVIISGPLVPESSD